MSTNEPFPPPVPTRVPPTVAAAHPSRSSRRGLSVGLAAGLLGGTAAGLVFGVPGLTSAAGGGSSAVGAVVEQSTDPSTSDPSTTESESSDETTTQDERATAHTARLRERLQTLVDAGTITDAQADAVADHLVAGRPDRGDFEGEGRGRFGGAFGRGAGVVSEALTDLLGLDAADLRSQLRDGATLAEIATAQGVDPQAVIDELVAELSERIDNAVENGRLDQAEADEKLADAEARITDRVNNGRASDDPDEESSATED